MLPQSLEVIVADPVLTPATIAVLFDDHLALGIYSDDNEPRHGEQGTCGGRHVDLALFV